MSNVNETLQRAASGEHRLNPDEQRLYFGTYRERVITTVPVADCQNKAFQAAFKSLLKQFEAYQPVSVKISSQLEQSLQIQFMKMAKEEQIRSTIVDESKADSPYGLVVHTDHAIDLTIIDALEQFPDCFQEKTVEKPEKSSFLSRFFKKKS